MLDDVIVLTIGGGHPEPAKTPRRRRAVLKLMSGVVMLGLGIALIAKPEWLTW